MHVGKTLFAQVMEFVPWTSFARIVHRYSGNAGARTLSCAEQYRAMAFARTVAESVSHAGAPAGSRRALMNSSPLARNARSTASSPSRWRRSIPGSARQRFPSPRRP